MNELLQQYVASALWTSTDEFEEPLDKNYSIKDLAEETLQTMSNDLDRFIALVDKQVPKWRLYWEPEQLAHDFWLTRNGHGAGFWDRAPSHEPEWQLIGEQLTKWAHAEGTADLYVGDDKQIYQL
jgi:hypothetical protein